MAKRKLGLEKGETTIISSSMPTYDVDLVAPKKPMSKRDYILTPLEPIIPTDESWNKTKQTEQAKQVQSQTIYNTYKKPEPAEEIKPKEEIKPAEHIETQINVNIAIIEIILFTSPPPF